MWFLFLLLLVSVLWCAYYYGVKVGYRYGLKHGRAACDAEWQSFTANI